MDPSIAVGPNSILLTTNTGLWLLNRDGTEIVDPVTLVNFFGGSGGVDTVSVYDRLSERLFVLTIDAGDIRLAVSQDDNPDLDPENWHFYEWDLGGQDGADYPELSVGEERKSGTGTFDCLALEYRLSAVDRVSEASASGAEIAQPDITPKSHLTRGR
ncbi:MAG: hypothetical protein IT430_00270 [Phycisphaerales bacterium]|nr:hypothetical protein [Phycisphaerales bacterium]